jgi:hypothetical protein
MSTVQPPILPSPEMHPEWRQWASALVSALSRWALALTQQATVQLPRYNKAVLPSAVENVGALIYVRDEAGGAVPAFSDGTNWRRVTDRAVVS